MKKVKEAQKRRKMTKAQSMRAESIFDSDLQIELFLVVQCWMGLDFRGSADRH